jgi:adenylate cyclase
MLAYKYLDELLERRRVTSIFGRYVAPQVVTELLKGGEESQQLGGTRKEITVLFVDIRGFTPMSEKAQPEEVVAILNDYLDLCARSIFKYGGTLDKFIGDATMAIFNAPMNLEDHALKAVQTAWAMKEGAESLRISLEERFGHSVQFGIGINTGYAIVGNIGSKSRMDYTAIGDTVNTSARLESNAKAGQILLSQATYELVKDKIKASYLGEISVKGKTQGIQVYQLEGVDTI